MHWTNNILFLIEKGQRSRGDTSVHVKLLTRGCGWDDNFNDKVKWTDLLNMRNVVDKQTI